MREAIRYLENAKEMLSKSNIEGNIYTDIKYVKSAFGIAYLAVLTAIDEYLTKRGLLKKELPKSVDAYRGAIQKYLAIHNGNLRREFESLYDILHIAGYYRGLINDVTIIKDALKKAKNFIEKVKE